MTEAAGLWLVALVAAAVLSFDPTPAPSQNEYIWRGERWNQNRNVWSVWHGTK